MITEAYNRGIFALPDFMQSHYTDGALGHVQFRIKLLCSEAARRVVVQEAARFQFLVYLNTKTRNVHNDYLKVSAINFDAPDVAKRWAKWLRKRPALATWFDPVKWTHNKDGRTVGVAVKP